jgi:hypothetical protein
MNRATLKAYSKLDGVQVQSAVTGAETSETGKLLRLAKIAKVLRRPVKEVLSLARSFHKDVHKYRNLPRHSKTMTTISAASNVWMEYRYGWRPLVYEIASYRDLLIEGVKSYDESVHRVAATQRTPEKFSSGSQTLSQRAYSTNGNWTDVMVNFEYRWKWSDKYTTIIYFRASALSDVEKYRVALGLTMGDLPGIAWELVPLSFVADWFVDTGLWLSAWKPKPGISVIESIQTRKRYAILDTLFITSVYPVTWDNKLPTYDVTSMQRVRNPARSALPTFNPAVLSLVKRVDSVSLIWQRASSILSSLTKRGRS